MRLQLQLHERILQIHGGLFCWYNIPQTIETFYYYDNYIFDYATTFCQVNKKFLADFAMISAEVLSWTSATGFVNALVTREISFD